MAPGRPVAPVGDGRRTSRRRAPAEATVVLPLTDREVLALQGPGLTAEDREILAAFAAQLATVLESDRLHAEAAEADSLARANQLRSALLDAVSHDLRTPLASIKAASSSLLSDQLDLRPRRDAAILLQTIDEEADRLNSLVENLLDMSRLQTGSMEVLTTSTDVGDVVDAAVASLGPAGTAVIVDVGPRPAPGPDRPGAARAGRGQPGRQRPHPRRRRSDSGSRPGRWPAGWTSGSSTGDPGIRREDRDRVFRPFQRLGDSENQAGVGLGLAVARGFVEAVGGELDVEDTPGGGCTMVVRTPRVDARPARTGAPPTVRHSDDRRSPSASCRGHRHRTSRAPRPAP